MGESHYVLAEEWEESMQCRMVAGSALRVKASVTEMLFSVDLESGSGGGCSARNHCAVSFFFVLCL